MEGANLQGWSAERYFSGGGPDLVSEAAQLSGGTLAHDKASYRAHVLKYSRDFSRPCRNLTFGSQPSNSFALVMSGRRRVGSSSGSGREMISLAAPVTDRTSRAHSRIVHSSGLPM